MGERGGCPVKSLGGCGVWGSAPPRSLEVDVLCLVVFMVACAFDLKRWGPPVPWAPEVQMDAVSHVLWELRAVSWAHALWLKRLLGKQKDLNSVSDI